MIKRRLLILAERLEKIAATPVTKRKRRFDLGTWFSRTPVCGSAACAMGEACFIPEFKRLGLDLHIGTHGSFPVFKGENGFGAAAKFFRLEAPEVSHLFAPSRYPESEIENPTFVAARIRQFVATGGV